MKICRCFLSLFVSATLLFVHEHAEAASRTWDGSASGNWSNGANWVGGVAPVAGDSLVFPVTATRYVTTNNYPGGTAFDGISINGSNYFFRGNSLVLQDDLRALAQGGSVTFDLAITIDTPLAQTQFESRYGSVLRFNNTLHIADANHPLQFINGVIRVAGAITGPGRIEAISGDLYFDGSAANTFGGSLELSIGNLYLNKTTANAAIPAGCIVERGGTAGWVRWLRDDQAHSSAEFHGLFLDLNQRDQLLRNFYTSCLLTNGTLQLSYDIIGSGAYLTGEGNGRIQLTSGNHQILSSNGISTVRYELTGPGNLLKNGPGAMWLEKSNSFTGQVWVYDGVVAVRDSHGLGTTNGGTFVYDGATLMLRNSARVVGEPLTLQGGGFTDPDLLEYLPHGYGALHAVSPSNAWTGPITLDGIASIGAQAEGDDWFRTNSVLLLSGVISGDGPLSKKCLGTVILSGSEDNTYTSSTFVREGRLKLDKNGATAVPQALWIWSPDENEISRVEYVRGAQIPDSANVSVYGGAVLAMHNQSDIIRSLTLYDGTVDTGTGALVLSETLIAGDDLQHPGNSRILGNGRLLFSPAAHDIYLNEDLANDFALEISCEVGGSGALSVQGNGSLFLGHSNSFSGQLTMAAHTLGIGDPYALGSATRGTIIETNATLALYAVDVPAEPLTLHGGASLISAVEFPARWGGPISFQDSGSVVFARGASAAPGNELSLAGVLSGPGDLRIMGGRIVFSGDQDNTQSGEVNVLEGTLLLSKTNATAIAERVRIGSDLTPAIETLHLLRPHQIADTAEVGVTTAGRWELNGFNETIGGLFSNFASDGGEIALGGATLTVDTTGSLGTSFGGTITGAGGFTKRGTPFLRLEGDNTYSGPTLAQNGELAIWGEQPASPVTVLTGAKLSGFGVVGHLNAVAGGVVEAGVQHWEPVLTTSNFTLQAGSTLRLKLFGPQSNQAVRVRGAATLNSPTLELDWKFVPKVGDTFKLVDNDGNDAVNGAFANAPAGLFTGPNGLLLEMTYGNDVTLRVVSPGQSTFPPGIGIIVTGGNGNGAIDPNECDQIRVTIANTGTNDLPPFKTMLVSDMAEAIITQPASEYPAIPVGGSAVNVTPFQISTTEKLECGTNIPCRLLVLTTNGSAFALDLPLPTGLPSTPVSYHANPNAPVLDGILTESVINVPVLNGYLASVEVSLLIEHTRSSDLRLSLVAPDGTEVLLAEDLGNGVNYGASCAPNARTRFVDSAANPITSASAPFVGTFRPQNYLATFRGMPGATVAGNWKLRVNDHVHFNTGFLRCWSLTLAPADCTDGGGACEPCPGPLAGAITAQDAHSSGYVDSFYGEASNCFSNRPCGGVVPGNFPYRAHTFTNLSMQPTCVSVRFTPKCVDTPGNVLGVAAYRGEFNPAQICENYLGDPGKFYGNGVTRTFSFHVPAASAFQIVVTAINDPTCNLYTLEVLSPDLCPVPLAITALSEERVRLDWPSHAGGYELQRTPALLPVNWSNVTNAPVITNGRFTVTNEVVNPDGFYRLRKP